MPGNGAILGPFASYAVEKRLSKRPQDFGQGAPAAVAGPESANNAGAQTSFIPRLTLGLPPNAVMALMAGAMMIQGIVPGPQVIERNPELFWGLVASMWIGNLPQIGLWVKLLRVPYRLLFPAIVCFCCIGLYSIANDAAQVMMAAFFGFIGYALYKLDFEPAPPGPGLRTRPFARREAASVADHLGRQPTDLRPVAAFRHPPRGRHDDTSGGNLALDAAGSRGRIQRRVAKPDRGGSDLVRRGCYGWRNLAYNLERPLLGIFTCSAGDGNEGAKPPREMLTSPPC